MNNDPTPSLLVYNASAGSGKTYSLVRSYLTRLLGGSNPYEFRSMLALTFTNKAVAEMKQRIVHTLIDLSKDPDSCKMLSDLKEATGLDRAQLQAKATRSIKALLNEYASFAVETIDSFNHRIVRTFAKDLKIGQHTDISLEVDRYLEEAVDRVIHQAGKDQEITKLLLDFTFFKMERGTSWNISFDLLEAAPDVLKEVEQPHLDLIKQKTLSDFEGLRTILQARNTAIRISVRQTAQTVWSNILATGVERAELVHHFCNAIDKYLEGVDEVKTLDSAFKTGMLEGNKKLYKVTKSGPNEPIKSQLDSLLSEHTKSYEQIRAWVFEEQRNKNIIKQLAPTATLHLIRQAVEEVKQERDLMFIPDFNLLIGEHIKTQPAPFIYERLGERYRHYFIDEFQDTSQMQWNNLIPLVENSLTQLDADGEPGTLLVVGDAKQAIYRWRGGQARQFVDLYQHRPPFSLSPEQIQVIQLESNWRSSKEIVAFNNQFFQHVGGMLLQKDYQKLYVSGNKQKAQGGDGGHVSLTFVEGEKVADRQESYASAVLARIGILQRQGFPYHAICILTRKVKEGVLLGQKLLEQGIPVISEETLLLKNAMVIQGVISCLRLLDAPANQQFKLEVLLFLHRHFKIEIDQHTFLKKGLTLAPNSWKELLSPKAKSFNLEDYQDLPLLDTAEYVLGALEIEHTADPTIVAFMDLLMDFQKQGNPTISGFLDYWELKKDKASAKGMGGMHGVRIMTIHKAKGLEFPAVIVPFIESDTAPKRWDTTWYPLDEHGFDEVRMRYSKQMNEYGQKGAEIYNATQSQVQLDMVNLLYVALTRPELELHLLSGGKQKGADLESCFGLIQSYLRGKGIWQEGKSEYLWGSPVSFPAEEEAPNNNYKVPYLVSDPAIRAKRFVIRPRLESESLTQAQAFGTLLHEVMAKIYDKSDLTVALELLNERNLYASDLILELENRVKSMVSHPDLSCFFNKTDRIYNEQELITPDAFLIPDRFQVNPEGATTLIDYKTGQPSLDHVDQIQSYKMTLEAMGYRVENMLLVYCSEPEILINKV